MPKQKVADSLGHADLKTPQRYTNNNTWKHVQGVQAANYIKNTTGNRIVKETVIHTEKIKITENNMDSNENEKSLENMKSTYKMKKRETKALIKEKKDKKDKKCKKNKLNQEKKQ